MLYTYGSVWLVNGFSSINRKNGVCVWEENLVLKPRFYWCVKTIGKREKKKESIRYTREDTLLLPTDTSVDSRIPHTPKVPETGRSVLQFVIFVLLLFQSVDPTSGTSMDVVSQVFVSVQRDVE